jgi:hypothetical protein
MFRNSAKFDKEKQLELNRNSKEKLQEIITFNNYCSLMSNLSSFSSNIYSNCLKREGKYRENVLLNFRIIIYKQIFN